MANTQAIKGRIRSVKSTKQITKAMELVAASKMRRAQDATLRSRAYSNTARDILTRLSELMDINAHPLYQQRKVTERLYVLVSSDRGLAGAYNSNILKAFTNELKADKENGITSHAIIIGRQGATFAARIEGLNILGVYDNFLDNPSAQDIQPILDSVITAFTQVKAGDLPRVDSVVVLHTFYKSSIVQEVTNQQLLPASFVPEAHRTEENEMVFEPSPKVVLETITPRLIEVQLMQAILESSASEHSMRMMAMKNASDNAGDIIEDLTLEFNSARQAAITQELAEITGGAEAIA